MVRSIRPPRPFGRRRFPAQCRAPSSHRRSRSDRCSRDRADKVAADGTTAPQVRFRSAGPARVAVCAGIQVLGWLSCVASRQSSPQLTLGETCPHHAHASVRVRDDTTVGDNLVGNPELASMRALWQAHLNAKSDNAKGTRRSTTADAQSRESPISEAAGRRRIRCSPSNMFSRLACTRSRSRPRSRPHRSTTSFQTRRRLSWRSRKGIMRRCSASRVRRCCRRRRHGKIWSDVSGRICRLPQ